MSGPSNGLMANRPPVIYHNRFIMKHISDFLMSKDRKRPASRWLWMLALLVYSSSLLAEGSKDFIDYPGYRLFLDNRNPQQMKVYANAGDYINVGASHVGIANGFIKVYRPNGTLAATFDSSTSNTAIIFNKDQEVEGPTAGGIVNGGGYVPGLVPVVAGEEGIWTVVIGFPVYQAANFGNLLNSQNWTRAANQPLTPSVILAWDITVSADSPVNMGGKIREGRVYSNEYVSVISQNGYMTSPTFYVLTKGGFQYKVSFMETDPFRFPITSVSQGFVLGEMEPAYNSHHRDSVIRSDDPGSWVPGKVYYYEPQAEDYPAGNLINNKIFFNEPDTLMPATALTTDIFGNNTHTTWLFTMPSPFEPVVETFAIAGNDPNGDPCIPGAIEVGIGANISFESSMGGMAQVYLDLNNNNSYSDPVDRVLSKYISAGANSITWDGKDGQGNTIPATENFTFKYKVDLRDGETHMILSDVENNLGGVVIDLISDVKTAWFDQFFYNHTEVGGPVSGNSPTGVPQPTNVPYTYFNNFGDNKMLDYWTYAFYSGVAFGSFTVDIMDGCATPSVPDSDGDGIRDNADIDDDNDGIPDLKEFCNANGGGFACLPGGLDPSGDADADGVMNYLDADDAAVLNGCIDADNDGICDRIAAIYDTDGDNVPDHLDLDSDNDGITDLVEAGHGQPDANGDGVIDGLPAVFGFNGLYNPIASHPDALTAVETYTRWDWDSDGVPDHDDLDSDNDGINDVAEAGYASADTNNDGRIGGGTANPPAVTAQGLANLIAPAVTNVPIPLPPDEDADNVPNWHDLDSDGDGVWDVTETNLPDPDYDGIIGTGTPQVNAAGQGSGSFAPTSNPTDTDGDGQPDYLDLDSDADNIPDGDECPVDAPCTDGDNDGKPDFQDVDRDNDGINDIFECENSTPCTDTDGDGTPDVDDLDTDGDGLADADECAGGAPCPDSDGDGIPDWRQYTCHAGTIVPAIEGIAAASDICEGETVTLTATNNVSLTGQVTYTWTGPANFTYTGTAAPQGPFPATLNGVTTASEGDYQLQVFTQHGCPSAPETVELTVTAAPPTPDVSISNPTPCTGDAVTLTTGLVAGANVQYTWYLDNQFLTTTNTPEYDIPFANPVNSGEYTVQVSNGTCESAVSPAETLQVSNVQNQAPQIGVSADVLCQGATLGLTVTGVSGANVSYQWYFNSGSGPVLIGTTANPAFSVNNVSSSNSGTYTVVASANGCVSSPSIPEGVVVGDNLPQSPVITLSDATPCLGETLQLTTTAYPGLNVSYSWMFNGPNGPQSFGNTTVPVLTINNVTAVNSGNFIVIASSTGCPPKPSPMVSVAVNTDVPGPVTLDVSGDVFCETETLMLTAGAAAGMQYEWYFDDGNGPVSLAVTNGASFEISNLEVSNTGTYTVHVISPTGCYSPVSNSEAVTVTNVLDETPALTVSSNTLCEGSTMSLTSSAIAGATYQWFFDNGNGPVQIGSSATNNFTINNVVVAASGTYFVQAAVSGCVSPPSAPQNVQVNTDLGIAPALTASATVICEGETLVLNSSAIPGAGVQYEWFLNGVSLSVTNQPTLTLNNLAPSSSGLYTVMATVGSCNSLPSNGQNVTVTTDIGPAPSLTVVADVLCEGATLELNSSIFNGTNVSYQWYFDNGSGPVLLATTNIPTYFIQNMTAGNEGIYTVAVASGSCTTQPSNAQDIEVTNELSNAPTLSISNNQFCQGEMMVLNSSIYPGMSVSYQWYFNNGSGPVLLGTTNVPTYFIQNMTLANAGNYSVVVTMGNCSTQPSNLQAVTVTNMTGPAPQLSVSGTSICQGEMLTLNSSIYPGTNVQYEWFFDDGSGPVLLATTSVPTYFIQNISPSNAGTYSVMAMIGGCETPSSNLQAVNVNSAPALAATNSTDANAPACRGDLVQLSVQPMTGATYQWNGPLGFSANVPNPILPEANPGQAGVYTVAVTMNGCTFAAAPTQVHIFSGIDAVDDVFDVNFNETLTNAPLDGNDLTGNVGDWSIRLVIEPKNGTASLVNGLLKYVPRQNFYGKDEFAYEICNLDCPDDCDVATIRVNVLGTDDVQTCFVPNIITPNGDGLNDHFKVPCLQDTYVDNNVRIFNRWGDLVYEQDRYKNDWDGRYKGNPLPPGTYFYLIQLEKGNNENCLQGYFTITR
jgi:gliding motility-associated-like protein